jgi:hypothetical protein
MLAGDEWYYMRDGGSVGPETATQLLELLDEGKISRQTLVWRRQLENWRPLEDALEFGAAVPPVVPGTLTEAQPIPVTQSLSSKHTIPADITPHPWRRYFARMFDTTVAGAVMSLVLGIVLFVINQNIYLSFIKFVAEPGNQYFNAILVCALSVLPLAICTGLTGTTLGKWIFGIAINRPDGQVIGFQLALWREMMVWLRGLGLGIPIIYLFTLVTGYQTLKKNGQTSWDAELGLVANQRPESLKQTALNIAGVLIWLVTLAVIVAM